MKQRRTTRIRATLRSEKYSDGLTVSQLSILCDMAPYNVKDALKGMPDAYIDRWVKERTGPGRMAAVWCVVVPPENCPPPRKEPRCSTKLPRKSTAVSLTS